MPFRGSAGLNRLPAWKCRYYRGWLVLSVLLVGAAWTWQSRSEAEGLSRRFQVLDAAASRACDTVGNLLDAADALLGLAQTAHALGQAGNHPGADAVLAHLREAVAAGHSAAQEAVLVGADGWRRWSSDAGNRPAWLGDRPYVRRRLPASPGGLDIDAALPAQPGARRVVWLTRLLIGPAGEVAGVAAVALDAAMLEGMVATAAAEAAIRVGVFGAGDGLELIGGDPTVPAAPDLAAAALAQTRGHAEFPDPDGGRLVAWRRLPDRAVFVAATLARTKALRGNGRPGWQLWAGVGLVVGAGFAVAAALHANAALRRSRLADPLTGLPGRGTLPRAFRRALSLSAGQGGHGLALLLIDIDRFRSINDSYGLLVGDAVLKAVARRLCREVRPSDTVLRLGADEFVLLLPGLRSSEDATRAARRLADALARPLDTEAKGLRVTASVGIALAPADGSGAEQLLRHADIALGHAKATAQGQVCHFAEGMERALRERQEIEQALRLALEREELELHFQPLFDLGCWDIGGFEALARWHRPGHGYVPPATFIEVAEQTGLMLPLGQWVLREATRQAATWPGSLKVAVNLSPLQFTETDLPADVARALAASGLEPGRLELEITEGVLLRDTETTLRALRALRGLGTRIALDDFGTGYASLSYLLKFPFDKVKIDRAFTGAIGTGAEGAEIVRAIIGMCRSLNIATCAEGVQTPEQLFGLKAEGCAEAQGYLLSAPRPAVEIPQMIQELGQILPAAA